jgi:hypothetical protein
VSLQLSAHLAERQTFARGELERPCLCAIRVAFGGTSDMLPGLALSASSGCLGNSGDDPAPLPGTPPLLIFTFRP